MTVEQGLLALGGLIVAASIGFPCFLLQRRQRRFQDQVQTQLEDFAFQQATRQQQYALLRAQIKTIKRALIVQQQTQHAPSQPLPVQSISARSTSERAQSERPSSAEKIAPEIRKPTQLSQQAKGSLTSADFAVDYRAIIQLIRDGVDYETIISAFDISRSELQLLYSLAGDDQQEKKQKPLMNA